MANVEQQVDSLQFLINIVVVAIVGICVIVIVALVFALLVWRQGDGTTLMGDVDGPSNRNTLIRRNAALNFTCEDAADFLVCTSVTESGLCINPMCVSIATLLNTNIVNSSTFTGTIGSPQLIVRNPAFNFTCTASGLLVCSSVNDVGLCLNPMCIPIATLLDVNITNSSTITGTIDSPELKPGVVASTFTTLVENPVNIRFKFRVINCGCLPDPPSACATNGICGPGNTSELSDTEANVASFRITRVANVYTISLSFATQAFTANDVCHLGCNNPSNQVFLETSWDVPPFNDTDVGNGLGATGYTGAPGTACFYITQFYTDDSQLYAVCFNARVITIQPVLVNTAVPDVVDFFGAHVAQLNRGLSYTYTAVA